MTNHQYFLLRRLHSLFGVFPLGLFLVNHLLTNASAVFGAKFFEHKVALIHSLGPALPAVEAAFIFIPLALHICIGIYIATQTRPESEVHYARNTAYKLQRASGWVALAFIAYHALHLRFFHDMQAQPFSVALALMFTEGALGFPGFFWIVAYLVGGAAVVFHFANGLCTFCMSWGITIGPRSQRWMAYAAAGIGAALMVLLVLAVVAFTSMAPQMDAAFVQELQAIHSGH